METTRNVASQIVDHLLEAGPDDLNLHAEIGKLKLKPWLAAFEVNEHLSGEPVIHNEIIVPVHALGREDAIRQAEKEVYSRYARNSSHFLETWIEQDPQLFADLEQVWRETGLEDYHPE